MDQNSDNQPTQITFPDIDLTRQLFGEFNSNLQRIATATDSSIHSRGNTVFIQGDPIAADLAKNVLNQLYGLLKEKCPIYPNDVDYAFLKEFVSLVKRYVLKGYKFAIVCGGVTRVARVVYALSQRVAASPSMAWFAG